MCWSLCLHIDLYDTNILVGPLQHICIFGGGMPMEVFWIECMHILPNNTGINKVVLYDAYLYTVLREYVTKLGSAQTLYLVARKGRHLTSRALLKYVLIYLPNVCDHKAQHILEKRHILRFPANVIFPTDLLSKVIWITKSPTTPQKA